MEYEYFRSKANELYQWNFKIHMKNFDVNTALKGNKNAVIIIFLFFTDRRLLFSQKYLVMFSLTLSPTSKSK